MTSEQNAIPKVLDSNFIYVSNILLLFYIAPWGSFKEYVTRKWIPFSPMSNLAMFSAIPSPPLSFTKKWQTTAQNRR